MAEIETWEDARRSRVTKYVIIFSWIYFILSLLVMITCYVLLNCDLYGITETHFLIALVFWWTGSWVSLFIYLDVSGEGNKPCLTIYSSTKTHTKITRI